MGNEDWTMRCCVIVLLGLVAMVAADAPAAKSLAEMVSWINTGKFQNNFFDGDGLVKNAASDDQKVAGCLLDKVGAITNEHGMTKFTNDLKVDLAACCTKGAQQTACISQLKPAYEALNQATGAD